MNELLVIDGKRVAAIGGATFERRDPFTGGWRACRRLRPASEPRSVTPEDIAALRDAGWSDDEIVEALIMASHSAWTTTVAQALHLEDDLGMPEFTGYF